MFYKVMRCGFSVQKRGLNDISTKLTCAGLRILLKSMAFDFVFNGEDVANSLSLSTFSSPAAYQQPAQVFNGRAPFAFSYYRKIDRWPCRANTRQSCPLNSCKKAVLAIMASLGALLMLITVYSFARRMKEQQRYSAAAPLSLDRKLSEKYKTALPRQLEVCAETQEATVFPRLETNKTAYLLFYGRNFLVPRRC